MTTVKISGAMASAAEREVYTSGTVGATLRFTAIRRLSNGRQRLRRWLPLLK